MAKIYKKSELQFVEGLVCDAEGNVLYIPSPIVIGLNRLEKRLQKAEFESQFDGVEVAERPEFEFVSMFEKTEVPQKEKPATPINDAKIAEALAFMEETDKVNDVEEFNRYVEDHAVLFKFAEDDILLTKVAEMDEINAFDLKTIGNPLELTKDKLLVFLEKTYR